MVCPYGENKKSPSWVLLGTAAGWGARGDAGDGWGSAGAMAGDGWGWLGTDWDDYHQRASTPGDEPGAMGSVADKAPA
eukprot:6938197-Prymnesium_polylepis.1